PLEIFDDPAMQARFGFAPETLVADREDLGGGPKPDLAATLPGGETIGPSPAQRVNPQASDVTLDRPTSPDLKPVDQHGATLDADAPTYRASAGGEKSRRPSLSAMFMPSVAAQRFKVIRPFAKGGLGTVSLAIDQELNREVAYKELQDRFADEANSRARFLLE